MTMPMSDKTMWLVRAVSSTPRKKRGLAPAGDRNQFDPSAQFDIFTQLPGCGQYLRISSSCVLAAPRFLPAHGPR